MRPVFISLLILAAACGSSARPNASKTDASPRSTSAADTRLGRGVTATQIKLGVMMLDYACVEQYVTALETQQQATFQIFIDDINARGGVNGRKLVPVYASYCPIETATEQKACTSLTDDNEVFAVVGTFYDPSGAAQLCFSKEHGTIVIADSLTQALVDRGPPGLMLTPNITPERRLRVIMRLLENRGTLNGKKVSIVDIAADKPRVDSVVVPALTKLGVDRGRDATLTISTGDTRATHAQVESFVELWKSDGTNALILVGEQVSSKPFVETIKAAFPSMTLVADTTAFLDGARGEQDAHKSPNPYEGIITAEGQTGLEHTKTPHFAYCRDIWEKATGRKVPSPNAEIKLPNGKNENLYDEVESACLYTTFFTTIAQRVGPDLNNANWVKTVDAFGPIDDTSTIYATIHAGKYDADDTYGLVAYDSAIGANGDWTHVTPVENVSGT